jgi:hypothetical protein
MMLVFYLELPVDGLFLLPRFPIGESQIIHYTLRVCGQKKVSLMLSLKLVI